MMKKFKKVFAIILVVAVVAALGVMTASASSETNSVSEAVSAAQVALGNVTSQVSISSVLTIIGIGLTASVGFFFMWFGIRWLIRKISAAIKSGRLPG